MRKKHQPGCPCCTTEPTYPCDCPYYQLRINITDALDEVKIYGGRFSPGPCNPMVFTGFSAINGTYYIDIDSDDIELIRVAASNNPQITNFMGTDVYYCLYLQVTTRKLDIGNNCIYQIWFSFLLQSYFAPGSCTPLNDVDFLSASYVAGSTAVEACEYAITNMSIQTTSEFDCPHDFWTCVEEHYPV